MGILDTFDPKRDGWSFQNYSTPDLSWDIFRQTYLAINPSESAAAPFDLAFYEMVRGCASKGNCGGMVLLALALFRFGGYMGFGSPAAFYSGGSRLQPPQGPARTDLSEAINIMQARQFSAPGIRNFVDVVKAGQLNDAEAAFERIKNGLASGDYHVLSIANSLFGEVAHTIIPYRADDDGTTKTLWVWDPNRPADDYPNHYSQAANRIDITGPTSWSYDQKGAGYTPGNLYEGSNGGWCFAVPTSLILHKGRNPVSVGFLIENLTYLFVTNTGSVAQIEDDNGRRLFADPDAIEVTLETSDDRRLEGVLPWPWSGGLAKDHPCDVFILERPVGSAPLTVTVRGKGYRLRRLASDQLVEVATKGRRTAEDRIRLEATAGARSVDVQTTAARRTYDIRHVRADGVGRWEGVTVRGAPVTDDVLRVSVPNGALDTVDVVTGRARGEVGIEFERFRSKRLKVSNLGPQPVSANGVLHVTPGQFAPRRKSGGVAGH